MMVMRPKAGRSYTSVVLTFAALMAVFFCGANQVVEAKRGCSAFGHSCFGGHGKRADLPSDISGSEIPSLQDPSQEVLASTADDASQPFPDDSVRNYDLPSQRYLSWMKVQPFLRQWLESYRRSMEAMETN